MFMNFQFRQNFSIVLCMVRRRRCCTDGNLCDAADNDGVNGSVRPLDIPTPLGGWMRDRNAFALCTFLFCKMFCVGWSCTPTAKWQQREEESSPTGGSPQMTFCSTPPSSSRPRQRAESRQRGGPLCGVVGVRFLAGGRRERGGCQLSSWADLL